MRVIGTSGFWMDSAPAVEALRFRRMPLLAAVLCFALGDILSRSWHAPVLLAGSTALLLLLAVLSQWRANRIAIVPALALWIVAGCWCAQIQPAIPPQTALIPYADGLSRIVRGRVVRVRLLHETQQNDAAPQQPQEPWRMEPGAWEADNEHPLESVDLDVQAIEDVTPDTSTMRPLQGGVRVTITGDAPVLACGDVLELPLRLRVPDTYRDPGAWSHAAALLGEGIAVQSSVKAARVHKTGAATRDWRCRLYAAQSWAASRIDMLVHSRANRLLPAAAHLSAEDAAILNAMLFGDRGRLSQTLRAGFERTGTFHLFVVSGLHIVLLSGVLFWILRKLRTPEGIAVATTIVAATGYALLTGFGVPVQRALGMTAVYLLARWLARESGALNALGVAGLAVLVFDPRALFEAGFQMTFLVILAIAGLALPLSDRLLHSWKRATHNLWLVRLDAFLPPQVAQLRVRLRMFGVLFAQLLGKGARDLPLWLLLAVTWACEAFLIGIVVELCMVLPMAVYFHRATLLALPLNLISVPLITVLICVAVLTFCVALLNSWLAMIPGAITALLLHTVRALVEHLGHIALADLRVPMPAPAAIALACAALVFCCWALRARQRMWQWVGVAAMAVIPLAVLLPEPPLLHRGVLEVTALDVGQGDSLLVVSPEGRTLLVDAGGPVGQQVPSPDRWDIGEEVVAPYLWSRRIRRLDAILLTHAHSDHMGGMPAVLRDLRPHELWLSVQPGKSPGLHALLEEAQDLGITVRWFRAGYAFNWGGLHTSVLAPEASYENPREAVNNDSLVMRLDFNKASVLLEGDAEAPSEAAMVEHGRVAPATLLKVGHHGSNTSTTPAFLAAVAPREAVISVGRYNTFGHPRFEVLGRLEAAHVKTFRTDRAGAETFLLTSEGGISAGTAASY